MKNTATEESDQSGSEEASKKASGLSDKKKALEAKLARLQAAPDPSHPSFDKTGALARVTRQLAEVNRVLTEEKK